MIAAQRIRLRRVHQGPARGDGRRVLVDGLWPRGVSKADAALDAWLRDVAPSTDLRRWYGHDVSRFATFAARYREELGSGPQAQAVDQLAEWTREGRVTLLTATRDVPHSHARVLRDQLRERV